MATLPPPLRQWWLKFSSLAEPGDASLRAGISRPHRLDFNYSFVVTKRGLVLGSEEQTVGVQTLTSAAQSFLWSLAFAVVPRAPRCARRHRAGHGPRWHGLRGCSGTWSLLPLSICRKYQTLRHCCDTNKEGRFANHPSA